MIWIKSQVHYIVVNSNMSHTIKLIIKLGYRFERIKLQCDVLVPTYTKNSPKCIKFFRKTRKKLFFVLNFI